MSRDCVLTVSVRHANCAETLASLAERRPLGPFTHCLLTYHKTIVLVLVVVV